MLILVGEFYSFFLDFVLLLLTFLCFDLEIFNYAEKLVLIVLLLAIILFTNPSAQFLSGINRFEFRVFLLLD